MSLKRDIVWRVGLIYLLVLIVGITIIGKIVYLQFVEKDTWIQQVNETRIKKDDIEPNRGDIYSHDERLLASSVPYYEIRMDMQSKAFTNQIFNKNIDSLAICLSNLFKDRPAILYKKQLVDARRAGERFYLVKNRVTYNELIEARKFPVYRLGKYKGGVIYIQKNKRFKPHGNLASRTIGYLSKGTSGNIVGLEGAYDEYLKGEKGEGWKQKIAGGVWIPIENSNYINPKDGQDIITTLDINLQDVAESALKKQLVMHDAHHGSAILMEVKTGEIKAIVNLKKDKYGNYRELYNYAIGESLEPGSTFKLASLMVALEDKVVDLDDVINTGDGMELYYDILLEDDKAYGAISVQRIFEVSSNVGISKIIMDNYKGKEEKFVNRLYSMNLNEKLDVGIRGEGIPKIKYPGDQYWHGASLAMMSIGYEVELTPLQILAFYNAVANNGKMVKPKFVREVRYHGKTVKTFPTEVINPKICSGNTIKKVKKMLEGVVENGTANNLKNSNYKIAGKTGTVKISDSKYGYKNEYRASFAGYFPADNPMYTCIVTISSPSRDVYYGREVAGPVFKEIADKVHSTSFDWHLQQNVGPEQSVDAPYTKMGFKTDLEDALRECGWNIKSESGEENGLLWVNTTKKGDYVEISEYKYNENLVPNVREMGAKDAVYLLEKLGLQVIVKGRGKVANQSIPPGSVIKPGHQIVLEMSFL